MVYVVDGGGTVVVLPSAASRLLGLGSSVDIGAAYYLFMACLAIFCTNAINILAGVNGLEVRAENSKE
jgi:UDP-N-acetylglucosamine--dolichyl-phosphate N-acetylglucosaminephosphotransferase